MIGAFINLLIYVCVVGLVVGLAYMIADGVPVPQPFNKIMKLVAMVVGVIILILLLLQMAGTPLGIPRVT
jgi:DMSO/TMAO reductase YedYZ heme-binding membrane subunit